MYLREIAKYVSLQRNKNLLCDLQIIGLYNPICTLLEHSLLLFSTSLFFSPLEVILNSNKKEPSCAHLHALICKQPNVVELQLGIYPQSCAGWRQKSSKAENSYGSERAS